MFSDLFDFIRTTAPLVHQIERVQGPQASRHPALVNVTQLRPQHVANLLVGDDLLLVPEHRGLIRNNHHHHHLLPQHVAEHPELGDDVHHGGAEAGPDHVVGGDGRVDPVHQDVGVPLLAVPDLLQEGLDVIAVDIVPTPLSLRLQNIFLRVGDGTLQISVSNLSLRLDKLK